MSKQLEAHLDDNETSQAIEKANAAEIIEALNRVIFQIENSADEPDNAVGRSKTNITYQNHRGIMRANAVNSYLAKRYADYAGEESLYTIKLLSVLIKEKTTWINSIQGKGKAEIIDALNALKVEIRSEGSLDIGDRLLGMGHR